MKCYNHSEMDTVGICIDCGVGLCAECSQKFNLPICNNCNIKMYQKEKELLINNIHKYIGIGLLVVMIGILLLFDNTSYLNYQKNEMILFFIQYIVLLYCFIFIGFGFDFLNGFKDPNTITVKVNESIFILITRKVIKLVIAGIIGGFIGPYQMYKINKRLKEINLNLITLNNNL